MGGPGIVLLQGQMGAGKTSFARRFCQELGCRDEVSSPTFSLVNQYRAPDGTPIYHFDCYRMRSAAEAYDIGMEEYLWSGAWCLIEWPDIARELLPLHCTEIRLEVSGSGRTVHWNVPYR